MANSLSGALGDIFWDLPPSITYTPGSEVGATLYVANPTSEEREYSLMARLTSGATLISEDAVRVYGYAWFKVDPGDFIRLHGALRFEETDVTLSLLLYERESGEAADAVETMLVAPTTYIWPPGWPVGVAAPTDWVSMFLPLMMLAMMGGMAASLLQAPEEEKE